jgi:hypothetical protein
MSLKLNLDAKGVYLDLELPFVLMLEHYYQLHLVLFDILQFSQGTTPSLNDHQHLD